MNQIKTIIERQKEFQRMVGFPVDTLREDVRNETAEKYLFKMIEEIVELRKEFPSVINPWSKNQKAADFTRVKEELSDIILFLINFINVWKFTEEELVSILTNVQNNNFNRVKEKKMTLLNHETLRIPGYTSGVGQGNLTPKYIFIGQNPGKNITHGYKFWSDPTEGSSKVLLPVLKEIGILEDCYFTNIVKSTTLDNNEPTEEETKFWLEFLEREIEILKYNNPDMKVIAMGNWTKKVLPGAIHIPHPASLLYSGNDVIGYERTIRKALALDDRRSGQSGEDNGHPATV